MESDVPVRLVLVDPPAGVDYGVQRGHGREFETLFVQQRRQRDVSFDFSLRVSDGRKGGEPNFLGEFVQGPPAGRFIYIDVGTCAGQIDTPWSRRMKIPLQAITWDLIRKTIKKPGYRLAARIPGTGKDGGPSCATVRLLGNWEIVRD